MKLFIRNLLRFIVPLILFFCLGFLLPATPRASKSLFFANLEKDKLLRYTPQPRIIFVGGSNLSFGLNSQLIKDSLKLNPVNTAVSASCGLQYMLDNTLQYIKEGDIVVLVPEYFHLFDDYNKGSQELLRTVFEVNPSKVELLNPRQLINIIPYVPEYTLSKLKPTEYFNIEESDFYSMDSFNEFGDTDAHWNEPPGSIALYTLQGSINKSVVAALVAFNKAVKSRNALLLISFPSYNHRSFAASEQRINQVAEVYKMNKLPVLGTPQRYVFPDSLMFDTPYHLIKKGVDLRTRLFIEDYRNFNTAAEFKQP